jgi:TetR/AcrR family tetracycline transcriptional repressor
MKTAPLDRDAVAQEALKLLDEVGIDGLTIRKLAERLDIKSASLYWHFKNKRDLLDAMAESMLAGTNETSPRGDWQQWLMREGRAFRKALLSHRDGARVHGGTRPSIGDYPQLELETRFLCDAGFSPKDALRAQMSISYFVVGWVLEEQAAAEAPSDEPRPVPDAAQFPTLARGQSVLLGSHVDADFEFGLQALVGGLAKMRRS